MAASDIYVSVVIPAYNEEGNLQLLFDRLIKVMDDLGKSFEIVFVNDGSKDGSLDLLENFHHTRPDEVVVIDFNGNFGQHMAIIAAFERVRGEVIVTLDADLQNPPEEIPKLLEKYEEGYDAIGGRRKNRQDSIFRRYASRAINGFREIATDIHMEDQGCMLRAYSRTVVDAITIGDVRSTFIPAVAYKLAANPTEIEVAHSERHAGESKYSLYKLIRLNFDLITGTTLLPLHLFTLLGFLASMGSLALVALLLFRRFIYPGASEAEGVYTLFSVLFFLISLLIVQLGLVGEYIGRTYQAVQKRPRYLIKKIYQNEEG